MNNCISCIKNGKTGECYDIKDKTSRQLIEELQEVVNGLKTIVNSISGVDGGHLATDTDISNLQKQITTINENIEKLDFKFVTEEDVYTYQEQIDEVNGMLNTLENKHNSEVTALQSKVNEIITELNGIDDIFATDEDVHGVYVYAEAVAKNTSEALQNKANLSGGNSFTGNQIINGDDGDIFVVKREGSTGQTVLANGTCYLESSDGKASYQTPTSITLDNENGIYMVKYPTKAGTVALLEDMTGSIKSETFNSIPELYNKIQSIASDKIHSICLNVTTPITVDEDGIQVTTSGVSTVTNTLTIPQGTYYFEQKTTAGFYTRLNTIAIMYMQIYSTDMIINVNTSGTQNGSTALFKKAMYWNDHCDGFDFTIKYYE